MVLASIPIRRGEMASAVPMNPCCKRDFLVGFWVVSFSLVMIDILNFRVDQDT